MDFSDLVPLRLKIYLPYYNACETIAEWQMIFGELSADLLELWKFFKQSYNIKYKEQHPDA